MKTVLAEDENAAFVKRVGTEFEHKPTADGAQGIMFTCPKRDCGHIYVIWFENPLNVEKVLPDQAHYPRWQRTGDTLENLTLSPSVHDVTPGGCGWHGWVKNGVAQ